jgi:DNA repair protein RecN (Recombination protein N)
MEEVEIEFGIGLSVLTGETGAGKSVIINALALLCGDRADVSCLRAGATEASVEGVFSRTELTSTRLSDLGLPDDGGELCIRRTIGANGRAKVHVNGSLSTVGVLQRLMKGLIDFGGQHEHLDLLDGEEQLAWIDRFSEKTFAPNSLALFREAWGRLQVVEGRRRSIMGSDPDGQSKLEFLRYQRDEFERLSPRIGEELELEAERRRLASSEKLRQSLGTAEELIASGDGAAVEALGRALRLVEEAERIDPSLEGVRMALVTAKTELDEAARRLSRGLGEIDADPRRLEEVDERLDALKRLARKHGGSVDSLVARHEALEVEIQEYETRAVRCVELEQEREVYLARASTCAADLTRLRREAAARLEKLVGAGLKRLAMKAARFEIAVSPVALGERGADQVTFLLSANAGEELRPLTAVASGGEVSRVMLSLRTCLAGCDGARVSVLDEADSGLGGAVADEVGRLIKDLSSRRQVLCITHLPQVAAHADAHLLIEKSERHGRTRALVSTLESQNDRARELGRMLSGAKLTREAVGAASALLRTARLRSTGNARQERLQSAEA